ncbi:MAG: small-conductance mechanosensitive channel [Psychrosphaera sp.]|jgi:small-conductance mechanosensitive channel
MQSQLAITIILILTSWCLKYFIFQIIKKRAVEKGNDKRYLINYLKNLINLLVVILLFAIWHQEIQRFAFSIAAFVVAIILVTREIIQCFIGFLYISSSTPFRVGDWIVVGGHAGEVTSTDMAKTTLLEVDLSTYSYTGKSLFVPNLQLITLPITNLNYMKRYVNHSFFYIRESLTINPFVIKTALLKQAKKHCAEFKDVAERYNSMIENRLDIKISGPEPSVSFESTELGKTKVVFSLFCPTEQAQAIEQKMLEQCIKLFISEEKKQLQLNTITPSS